MFGFYKWYFLLAVILFITEILIAAYMHDAIIRPYGGDFLVVMLVYCAVKSIVNTPVIKTAIGVLIFSYLVEISQYFHLVDVLGLGNNKLARIVMGTYFCFTDLVCYTLGIAVVVLVEKFYGRLLQKNNKT